MSTESSTAGAGEDADGAVDPLQTAARELGAQLADTPEHERFVSAQNAVRESTDAQERIAEFEQLRDEYSMARRAGEVDEESLVKLKEAQQELHELPVMADYLEAQDALDERLEAVAQAISAPLDVEFTERVSGCCED